MCMCIFAGVGHCEYRAEAEKGADWPEPLGSSPGGLSEPPVQRFLPDHKGKQSSNSLFLDIILSGGFMKLS